MTLDTNLSSQQNQTTKFGLGMFVPLQRSIAGLTADVWVEETQRDDLTVTEHPVEQGAPIADHFFKRPAEVVIRAGWSMQKSGDLSAQSGVYGWLLNWQASGTLFDLYTGKRRYQNMLIGSLWTTTDHTSEYALMVTLVCREVILTKTQVAKTGLASDSNNLALPQVNSQTIDAGTQAPSVLTSPSSNSFPATSFPGLDTSLPNPNLGSSGDPRVDLILGSGDFTVPDSTTPTLSP